MERLFGGIDSTLVPLLLTAVGVVVLPLDEAFAGESVAALIQAVTWLVIGIPLWTAVRVYLALQIGLNRLGRGQLTLGVYRGDRSLGLRPVGRLAFTTAVSSPGRALGDAYESMGVSSSSPGESACVRWLR